MKVLEIGLPAPHETQRLIEADEHRRVVVAAGRRFGKTTLAARKSAKLANDGLRVLYAAPIASQTNAFWDNLVRWLWSGIASGMIYRNETKRFLRWNGSGGTITARTAHLPDHLRGDHADYLILDEYAYQNPDVWNSVGQPMLLDTNGAALFISTANFRNHFFVLALHAMAAEGWAFHKAPSTSNPFLSREALDQLAADMTPEAFKQEVQAEFIEGEGTVFRLVPEDFGPAPESLSLHKGHRAVAGLDWGLINDFTALSIGCATCSRELILERMQGATYPAQIAALASTFRRVMDAELALEILAEANVMGQANIDAMREDGFPVEGIVMTNPVKAAMVQDLRLAFERRAWKWINDLTAWRELEGFEGKLGRTGIVVYNAPPTLHDDTVIARLLMLRKAQAGGFTYVS